VANDNELVAGEARDDIGAAGQVLQAPGRGDEHLVADGMPESVVDVLEAIEIDVVDPQHAAGTSRAADQIVEAEAEEHPVGQAGQRIMMREIADARFGFAPLAEVAHGKEDLLAGLGRNHPLEDFGRYQFTAGGDEIKLERHGAIGRQRLAGGLAGDRARKLAEVAATDPVGRHADQVAEALVCIDDHAIAADDDSLEGRIGERRQAARFALPLGGEHAAERAADHAEEEDDQHGGDDRQHQPRLGQGHALIADLCRAKHGHGGHAGEMVRADGKGQDDR